jgi:hypothetical protein
MRLHLAAFIGALLALAVVTAGFAGGASAVNPKCYRNHASRPGSLLWWSDCADNWGPHAFYARELRAAKGRPQSVKHSGNKTWWEYRKSGHDCVFEFNRRGQALLGYCAE